MQSKSYIKNLRLTIIVTMILASVALAIMIALEHVGIAVLAVTIVLGIAVLLYHSKAVYFLLVCAIPISSINIFSGEYINGLIIFAFLGGLANGLERTRRIKKNIIVTFLFLCTILVSAQINNVPLVEVLAYFAWFVLLYVSVLYIKTPDDLIRFAWFFVSSLTLASLALIGSQLSKFFIDGVTGVQELHLGVFPTLGISPQRLVLKFSMGIPLVLFLYYRAGTNNRTREKIIAFGCFCLLVLGNLLAFSLSGLIALVASILLSVHFLRPRRTKFSEFAPIILFCTILLALVVPFQDRITSQLQIVADKEYIYWLSGRGIVFTVGLLTFKHAPWFGHGPSLSLVTEGMLDSLAQINYSYFASKIRITLQPHNVLLNVAIAFGGVGLVLYLMQALQIMIPLSKRKVVEWRGSLSWVNDIMLMRFAIFLSLITFFVQGMGTNVVSMKEYWLLLGIGLASLSMNITATSSTSENGRRKSA